MKNFETLMNNIYSKNLFKDGDENRVDYIKYFNGYDFYIDLVYKKGVSYILLYNRNSCIYYMFEFSLDCYIDALKNFDIENDYGQTFNRPDSYDNSTEERLIEYLIGIISNDKHIFSEKYGLK